VAASGAAGMAKEGSKKIKKSCGAFFQSITTLRSMGDYGKKKGTNKTQSFWFAEGEPF